MAVRSTRVVFHNYTEFSLSKMEDNLPHGEWTDPWFPPDSISANNTTEWRSESDGIATGTEGSARYRINNGEDASVYVHWNNPFDGTNKYHQFTGDKFEVFKTGGSGNNTTWNSPYWFLFHILCEALDRVQMVSISLTVSEMCPMPFHHFGEVFSTNDMEMPKMDCVAEWLMR